MSLDGPRCQIYFPTVARDCHSLSFASVHISLTPELENAVKAKAASGYDNNASEVVREASIGFAQLEAGQTVEVKSEKHFINLLRGKA